MLLLFELHRLPQRERLAFQQCFLVGELAPFALRVFKLQLRLLRAGGGLDGASGVEPGQHVALGHRLAFGHVEVDQFAVDRRVKAPDLGGRHQRALGGDDHVGPSDE